MADSQKQQTYEGEFIVRDMLTWANQEGGPRQVTLNGTKLVVPVEYQFACVESIQQYVDKVLAHPGVRETWPRVGPIKVRPRKGTSKAHYEHNGTIAIPMNLRSWACREIVIIHEIAHHLSRGHGHDATFRRAMHTLARLVMAPEVGLILQMVWHGQGLEV